MLLCLLTMTATSSRRYYALYNNQGVRLARLLDVRWRARRLNNVLRPYCHAHTRLLWQNGPEVVHSVRLRRRRPTLDQEQNPPLPWKDARRLYRARHL